MRRILLAEDEAITAALMERVLKRNGYQMLGPCATGLDAVYAALAHHIEGTAFMVKPPPVVALVDLIESMCMAVSKNG